MTVHALARAGVDLHDAMGLATAAHADPRAADLIARRRELLQGLLTWGRSEVESTRRRALVARRNRAGLLDVPMDQHLPELLARVEVARELDAERVVSGFDRPRSEEQMRRVEARREYLAGLTDEQLSDRVRSASLDPAFPRAVLVESLSRHETAQEMTVEMCGAM